MDPRASEKGRYICLIHNPLKGKHFRKFESKDLHTPNKEIM